MNIHQWRRARLSQINAGFAFVGERWHDRANATMNYKILIPNKTLMGIRLNSEPRSVGFVGVAVTLAAGCYSIFVPLWKIH